MVKHLVVMAAFGAWAGCGGHKQPDTTPTADPNDRAAHVDNSNMIPPEKMDEVAQDLKRRNMLVSRCLATGIENGELKRGTHGHIAFSLTVGTDGHASSVKVIRTDIEAKSVLDCATKHVQDTGFPELSKPYETSYTYAVEAN